MKLIIKVITVILFGSIILFSCNKDKSINIQYLTKNTWIKHRLFFRDLSGNEQELTSIWFKEECRINNTHKYLSNQLYINYEDCGDTVTDTMIWQYNEKNHYIEYYRYSDPDYLWMEMKIEKLNETEMILVLVQNMMMKETSLIITNRNKFSFNLGFCISRIIPI